MRRKASEQAAEKSAEKTSKMEDEDENSPYKLCSSVDLDKVCFQHYSSLIFFFFFVSKDAKVEGERNGKRVMSKTQTVKIPNGWMDFE